MRSEKLRLIALVNNERWLLVRALKRRLLRVGPYTLELKLQLEAQPSGILLGLSGHLLQAVLPAAEVQAGCGLEQC